MTWINTRTIRSRHAPGEQGRDPTAVAICTMPSVQPPLEGTEFFQLADRLGIDPAMLVDPCGAMLFAAAHRSCADCPTRKECRAMLLRNSLTLRTVSSFCPSAEILLELLDRSLPHHA